MTPSEPIRIFGTAEETEIPRLLAAGPCTMLIGDGAMRGLFWRGTEVLRGIDYPVRDRNWGTFPATTLEESVQENGTSAVYHRRFSVGDEAIVGGFTCRASADGTIEARLQLAASRDIEVNRAGFVVLHPIAGFAGTPIRVTHPDGTSHDTQLPTLISPSQPLFNIAGLRQIANGFTVDIAFSGEVFEMEDQRNWSDASFKTYCRPLSWPSPYWLRAGETVGQVISISLSGGGAGANGHEQGWALQLGEPTDAPFPEIALAVERGWTGTSEAVALLPPAATLVRIDLTDAAWPASLPELLDSVRGKLDLEVVVPDEVEAIGPLLERLREALGGSAPRSVTSLPKAYLKSYQPQASWPRGASPERAIAVTRQVFTETEVGGGMLTNFTELNRYRGGAAAGDFITHGTTAIVHAADDLSVMQTLEALPQIFASAEALESAKPYRLGLVSLGMRSNPYGDAVADNSADVRRAMAMNDPRQRGLFGAAWMVGAAAAMADSSVDRVALAAPAGPFGLSGEQGVFPAYYVFAALCRMAGKRRLGVRVPHGLAATAVEHGEGVALLLANLTDRNCELHLPEKGLFVRLEDSDGFPDWLARQQRQRTAMVKLGRYGVVFVTIGSNDFFGRDFA